MATELQERPREAAVLRMVREEHGLSQDAVGFIAGCSRTWTSQLEAGVMKPAPERIARLGSKVDPRLMQQAVRMVTGGAFVSPVLDGKAVDLHRSAVAAKCREEINEAIDAIEQVCKIIGKPRPARNQAEAAALKPLCLQLIDVERAVQNLMVALAKEDEADINNVYREHDDKLAARGYTRESTQPASNGRSR